MEEMHELAADLKIWVDQHSIVERSVESFFEIIEYFQRERSDITQHFPDASKEHFTVMVSDVWIILRPWLSDDYSVVAVIPIIYKGKKVGRYSTIFLLSGEWEDDVWDMKDPI